MNDFRYTLQPYNGPASRHRCPSCGKPRQFALYIDQETGEIIDETCGRCNREVQCGYHLKPKEYFEQNPDKTSIQPRQPIKSLPIKQITYIPDHLFNATLKAYESNTFVQYLNTLFKEEEVSKIIQMYRLGTTREGGCIFWQIDNQYKVRAGKVIHYRPDGHRDKSKDPYFIKIKLPETCKLEQVLFGQHLLNTLKPIALVEAEKTACLYSIKFQSLNWVATGGKSNSLEKKAQILKGKKVIVFPDSDAQDDWANKLSSYGFKISMALIANILESQKRDGLDIADYIKPTKEKFDQAGNLIDSELGFPVSWKTPNALERMEMKYPNLKLMVKALDLIPVQNF